MVYVFEYTYPGQEAHKSYHFVEAVTEIIALYKAQAHIAEQLYYLFRKDTEFNIEKIKILEDEKH